MPVYEPGVETFLSDERQINRHVPFIAAVREKT
jgi:hypothetical protein